MRKILILIFLSLITFRSYSCSCSDKPSIETNWKEANDVFIGKIIEVDTSNYGNNGAKIYAYTIKIIRSFKKEFYIERNLRTILGQGESSCDFMFELGKTYLVYARTESQTLASSICSRTDLSENIENTELTRLESLRKTYDPISVEKVSNNISYQIDLVKNSFQEKLASKNQIISILFIGIILLLVILVIKLKRISSH